MPKLIPEWRQAPRMLSMQAMAVAGAIQATLLAMPDDVRAKLPQDLVQAVPLVLLVLGIVGRLVQQPSIRKTP